MTGALTFDPDQSSVVGVALGVARANGDPSPMLIEWVYGPRAVLTKTLGFEGPAEDSYIQALVVVHGTFTAPTKRGPSGLTGEQRTHGGSVITLLINPGDWVITDYGIGTFDVVLGPLGPDLLGDDVATTASILRTNPCQSNWSTFDRNMPWR